MENTKRKGFWNTLRNKATRLLSLAPVSEIKQADMYMYGGGVTTVASLLGGGRKAARSRQIIYLKWMRMEADPIISSAIQLLVTAALGGHETSGDLVFIEEAPEMCKNKKMQNLVKELQKDLGPIFNKIAFPIAYTGCIYGDAYARLYTDPKRGLVDVYLTELLRPQLVQPFEIAGRTVGYGVTIGEQNFIRLDATQVGRFEMPRTQYIPQFGVVERSYKINLEEDNRENCIIMPAQVGGSLLYPAEVPYDYFCASLLGLVGQRWLDSIDEQMVTVNMQKMSKDQRDRFIKSLKTMLERSREVAEKAISEGTPILERIRHVFAVHDEKQLTQIQPLGQSGRNSSLSTEDVLFHAKLLAGALGVDISMLGFADQLSGGLGEGGFFRISAHVAERARIIRVALAKFFDSLIDIHTLAKYGTIFDPTERPWKINFFGSISALEAERQRTKTDAMAAGQALVQTMQQLIDLGANEEIMSEFLKTQMMLDEDQAETFAKIVKLREEKENGGFEDDMNGGGFPENPLGNRIKEAKVNRPKPNLGEEKIQKTTTTETSQSSNGNSVTTSQTSTSTGASAT